MDAYRGNGRQQYEIVSQVAYLIGIDKKIFLNENEPPKLDIYKRLEQEKKARIIRNLCLIRDALEHNFLKVCQGIQLDGKSILGMPELIPSDAMQQLSDDGVKIYANLKEPTAFLIMLNKFIKTHINNCRDLFPSWLNWDYLSEIFIMPDGLTEEGTKESAEYFYANMMFYPYQRYMNWPAANEGNILLNDKKFVILLYKWHGETFSDYQLVSDASAKTKDNIYSFIDNSEKCIFIVDCENSDPYNLCAAINNLEADKLSKISKIILFDDVHTASAWEILATHVHIPVEYILIERLKENKSLVDIKVSTRTCKEFYANHVDSFVLVSSDSDYWGMLEELPEAKFMVMVEHEKCSYTLKEALISKNIFYCYLDSFYAGGSNKIKADTIQRELAKTLRNALDLNLYSLMYEVLHTTYIRMKQEEIDDFVKNRLKNRIKLDFDEEGNVKLDYEIKRKL